MQLDEFANVNHKDAHVTRGVWMATVSLWQSQEH